MTAYAAPNNPTLQNALAEVRSSVENFINIKDDDSLEASVKDLKKLESSKNMMQKIVNLGLLEVETFKKELGDLAIEDLITSDYTFDAAEANDTLVNTLTYYGAYFASTGERIQNLKTYSETQSLARDLKIWRTQIFNPGIERIIGLKLVLRNKNIIKIANNRFEKILIDLKKLKNAKLITFDALQASINGAAANINSAEALDTEATALIIKILKTSAVTENKDKDTEKNTPTDFQKINNLVEQSFVKIKDTYKKFIETNELVKKMIGIS